MRSSASGLDIVRVVRKRRAFGLDAPRPPDLRRTLAEIAQWLGTHMPEALVLRLEGAEAATQSLAATLVLLLPGARIALLRIETACPAGRRADHRRLAAACATRRIPWAVVGSVEDTRAALRRLGHEPKPARTHAEDL